MIAVDEIDIGMSGRAKKNGIAKCSACRSVSRRILFAEVGFHFNDACGEPCVSGVPNQNFPKELAGYEARVAGEEGTIERADRASALRASGAAH